MFPRRGQLDRSGDLVQEHDKGDGADRKDEEEMARFSENGRPAQRTCRVRKTSRSQPRARTGRRRRRTPQGQAAVVYPGRHRILRL